MSNGRGFSRSRRAALAGGAALVLGGAAVGAVAAQQHRQVVVPAPSGAPGDEDFLIYTHASPEKVAERRDAWLNSVAQKLGVTPDQLKQAMEEAHKELGFPPGPLVPPLFPAAGFTIKIDPGFGAAARALNITEEQLREEWQGRSLADVAKSHNVDPTVVADAIKAQRIADLDKAVAEGKLPPRMAEHLKSHLDMEIEHFMNLPGTEGGGPAIIRFERRVERTAP